MNWYQQQEKNKEQYTKWIKSLKVGDKVAIENYGYRKYYTVGVVDKITPTGRINVGTYVFRPNGTAYGKGGLTKYLTQCTPEIEQEVEYQTTLSRVRNMIYKITDGEINLTRENIIAFDNFFKEQGFYDD